MQIPKIGGALIFMSSLLSYTSSGYAQKFNKHSVELSVGNHSLITKSLSSARSFTPSHFMGSYRFSFNNKFGLNFGLAYDRFVWRKKIDPTNHFQFSVSPTFNLSEILGISEVSNNFGLMMDIGLGIGVNQSKNSRIGGNVPQLPEIYNNDRTWFTSVGLSPHYLVKKNIAVFIDFSYNINFKQQLFMDMTERIPANDKIGTGFLNTALGVRYYIGKELKHADWFPSPKIQKEDVYRILSLESQVELLQMKLDDYDEDGVINAIDQEPQTPKGNKVDARGITVKEKVISPQYNNESLSKASGIDTTGLDALIKEKLNRQVSRSNKDTDGDGFPDDIDLCPDLKGSVKGCPDSDGDEIPDILDKCPNEKGLSIYSGCKEPYQDPKLGSRVTTEIVTTERVVKENFVNNKPKYENNIDSIDLKKLGVSEIYFASGSTALSIENMDKLNKIAAIMKDNPKLKITITGFADNTGNLQTNENFAKKRAEESLKFLVQQGIESERLTIFHKVVPADPKNASKLRKASFTIKK
jgi:hypothetical protein